MRVRVAISTPGRDPDVLDPGRYSIHIGHAQTMYLGAKIAREKACPFDVRLDGNIGHFSRDLSQFVLDIMECLKFWGIEARKVYWQPQKMLPKSVLDRYFTDREQSLLEFIEWDKGPTDLLAIMDDILHDPSIIVRANEFKRPYEFVGRPFIGRGMQWYTELENTVFELAGVVKREINVPLITIGGYKVSKEEGRGVHWRVLESIGREKAIDLIERMAVTGESWEWSWPELGKSVKGNKERMKALRQAAGEAEF